MSGLGSRGQDKVSANELFRKTDNTENSKDDLTQSSKNTETHEPVRKQYVFAYELSEKLRELAFRERRKEVDIVRDALAEYLEKRSR